MTPLPDESVNRLSPLTAQLIGAIQALAAAHTQAEVVTATLEPALRALGAKASALLLVDDEGTALQVAGHLGHDPGTLTLWQDGPINGQVPAADVLRAGQALYFEHAGALKAAYPALEDRTGPVSSVASAVLPMFLAGHPLGSLVLDFTEPHIFSEEEKYFLRTLAAQCSVALDRAGQLDLLGQRLEDRGRRIAENARAQEAFTAFTEAVGSEIELPALIRQAITVLQARFPDSTLAYYERDGDLWKARLWSDDISPELAVSLAAGLPVETPLFAQALHAQQLVFTDTWDAEREGVELTEEYGAVAGYPLILGGEVHSVLAFGLRNTRIWNAADQGLVRAVGRGLNLALERTQTSRALKLQNTELQARTGALEAFAELTRDLALTTEPRLLVQRAQEVMMSLLPDGASVYYELEGGRWTSRAQYGSLQSPELQAAVDAGLPFAEARNMYIPWTTGRPYFQDVYEQNTDNIAPLVGHIAASATLPLNRAGKPVGVLAIALFNQRAWSPVDRVVLETAVQSLELALDRAAQTQTLEEERAALAAFTRFTEQVGSETDVQLLVQQAITLLVDTCGVDAAYFERDGDLFKISSWNPAFDFTLLPFLQQGFALQQSGIAQVLLQNSAAFIDHWNDTGLLIPETGVYLAVAGHPYFVDGQLQSVLMIGTRTSATWAERERRIFQAVGRSLDLALNRARQTRHLDEERAALEAFTRFTEAVGGQMDVQVLVRQAITLLFDTCGVDVTYLEREGDLYKATAWNPGYDPALLSRLQAGFPLRQSSLALILRRQEVAFINYWDAAAQWIDESRHLRAVAGYPFFQDGEMESVLIMGSRKSVVWTERKKGIFRAVGRSLDLALDRARQAWTMTAQRDALDARTQELAASTREIEAFSYSISHDLRTPVRHMLGFLKLARTSLDTRIDERSARYLDVIEQSGEQMNVLIDAMLNLSNTAQQPLKPTTVDLGKVVAQLQEALVPDLLTRNIRWEVTPLPSVQGDQDALRQVLSQLIENALKFTRTRDPAVIQVWPEDQGETWKISVKDNGLGFDPRYQERLFNLFQRLHSAREAAGSGVGLASVRRLILKHGGQVFAEGQLGEGATFGFVLPKSGPPRP